MKSWSEAGSAEITDGAYSKNWQKRVIIITLENTYKIGVKK